MKHVPRSAAAHGSMRSVPPSSKVKRTSGSAATQKVQMSAPVSEQQVIIIKMI